VFSDLLLYILKGLKGRGARSNGGFNVSGGNKRAVKSKVLIKSIS
jgi:hypothetical protein